MGELVKPSILPYPLMSLLCLLSACNGGSNSSTTGSTIESQTQTAVVKSDPLDNENIAKAIYYNLRTPDDFYHEPDRDTSNFYIIDHIKNTDIHSSNHNETHYQLCSNNFEQALQWSEEDTINHPQYEDLMDNSETNLFYEFTRVNGNEPANIRLNRVFKCDAFRKQASDHNTIGYIGENNLNTTHIKNVLDYLWTISPHNNYGYAVLTTDSQQNNEHYQYSMIEAILTPAGNSESCDSIEVLEIQYTISKSSGLISAEQSHLKSILTKYENSTYHVCD